MRDTPAPLPCLAANGHDGAVRDRIALHPLTHLILQQLHRLPPLSFPATRRDRGTLYLTVSRSIPLVSISLKNSSASRLFPPFSHEEMAVLYVIKSNSMPFASCSSNSFNAPCQFRPRIMESIAALRWRDDMALGEASKRHDIAENQS